LIKEPLNISVYDFSTGAAKFYADYAMSVDFDHKGTRLDLRGGQGNYTLLSFDHTKISQVKTKLPIVDLNFMGLLAGKALSTGATLVPKREFLTVSASNTITLYSTPVTTNSPLQLFILNSSRDFGTVQTAGNPATTVNTYSILGNTITLNSTSCPQNSTVAVFYDYLSPSTSNQIQMTANIFPGYYRMTGEGLMTDQISGVVYPVAWDVKKCKPQVNFTITQE